MAWCLMNENVGAFRGPSSTSAASSGLRDGAFRRSAPACRIEIANWGWDFAAFAPYADVQGAADDGLYGSTLRAIWRTELPRQTHLGILLEQLPRPGNRVTIDERYVDALGQPRPVIHYKSTTTRAPGWRPRVIFATRSTRT